MAKKYVDSEKLIAEIDRLYIEHSGKYENNDACQVLDYLEDFINFLQQEQPSEDLEKEMERFLSNITPAFKDGSYKITRLGFRAVARHFYEFGKNSK